MKNGTVLAIQVTRNLFLIASLIVLVGLAFPSQTFAAQIPEARVSVQTAQLLPPGSNTCTPPPISNFTPYIYDGALHAFELTVSDSSYVALVASAGNTNIPFNQMTRRLDPSGVLRVHVDMMTTPIRGSLDIRLTMLSAKGGGQPVCVTVVSVALGAGGLAAESWQVVPPRPAPAPMGGGKGGVSTTIPRPGVTPGTSTVSISTSTRATSTTGMKGTSTSITSTQNFIKDMCSSAAGALRLWAILLIVYALIVIAAIAGQPQLPAALRTQEWAATVIVIPFLLLFGLWYFAESCRTSSWIPVIATVIALVGLSAAFWERKGGKGNTPSMNVINLPGAKK